MQTFKEYIHNVPPILYHGTSSKNINSIKQRGLVVLSGNKNITFPDKSRGGRIYLSQDIITAWNFAVNAWGRHMKDKSNYNKKTKEYKNQFHTVLIKVQTHNLNKDNFFPDINHINSDLYKAYEYHDDIPASEIIVYSIYDTKPDLEKYK